MYPAFLFRLSILLLLLLLNWLFPSSLLDNQFWIGIYFNQTSFYWLDDGTEVTWSKWMGPRSACALMTGTQKWTSERCAFYHQYICELEIKSTTPGLTLKL